MTLGTFAFAVERVSNTMQSDKDPEGASELDAASTFDASDLDVPTATVAKSYHSSSVLTLDLSVVNFKLSKACIDGTRPP